MKPTLPSPDARRADESIDLYAARLLTFVLSTSITVTLNDVQLDLVDMAIGQSLATLPTKLDAVGKTVLDKLNATRDTVSLVRRLRKRFEVTEKEKLQPTHPVGGERPGRPAVLLPAPVPKLPPATAFASFTF